MSFPDARRQEGTLCKAMRSELASERDLCRPPLVFTSFHRQTEGVQMATLNVPGGWAVSVNTSNKPSGGRKTTTVIISFTGKAGSAKSKRGSAKKK